MLGEVVIIVRVEERLDSIWTVDCSVGNVLCRTRKKFWTTVFCSSKSIVISEASINGIYTKVSTMWGKSWSLFEYKNALIPSELWTVAYETYFAQPVKNCEQRSFAAVNLSSFLRIP